MTQGQIIKFLSLSSLNAEVICKNVGIPVVRIENAKWDPELVLTDVEMTSLKKEVESIKSLIFKDRQFLLRGLFDPRVNLKPLLVEIEGFSGNLFGKIQKFREEGATLYSAEAVLVMRKGIVKLATECNNTLKAPQ